MPSDNSSRAVSGPVGRQSWWVELTDAREPRRGVVLGGRGLGRSKCGLSKLEPRGGLDIRFGEKTVKLGVRL
jgi:hypothetical protein